MMAKALEFAVENLRMTFRYKMNFNEKRFSQSTGRDISNNSIFGIRPIYPRDINRLLQTDGNFISYFSSYEYSLDDQFAVCSVVPQDLFTIQALLDIVCRLNWKYVSVISAHGENGRIAAQHFIDSIEEAESCLDLYLELSLKRSTKTLKEILNTNSSAIIAFTMAEDTVYVIRYIDELDKKDIQLLFAFGTINYDDIGKTAASN